MPKFNSITEKALFTNRAKEFYGTFAEIGAGQEVVRHFFHAGSASGSIAKSMSAYDKAISDDIYGKETRYVCEARLEQMLKHEYDLLINRLDAARGAETRFFVYANTVTTHPQHGGHAWMGIDFQKTPRSEISRIVVHVRLLDDNRLSQQEAVGIIGVNLVYGAFYLSDNPKDLIESLKDHLGTRRYEIDMLRLDGPGTENLDHRELSLHLVRKQLAKATMFGPNGETLQPAEVLYKKDVLVQRGAFRPVTKVNADMCRSSLLEFVRDRKLDEKNVITLMELTLNSLLDGEETDDDKHVQDFLDRATLLQAMGHHVMVSNYPEYYLLSRFLNTLSTGNLAMVIGTPRLLDIFDEQYYEKVDGGILEAIGKLFRNRMHIYAYPWLDENDRLLTAYNLGVTRSLEGLYRYLLDNNYISALDNYSPELPRLRLSSKEVLDRIQAKDGTWEELVPDSVGELILAKGLFGASD